MHLVLVAGGDEVMVVVMMLPWCRWWRCGEGSRLWRVTVVRVAATGWRWHGVVWATAGEPGVPDVQSDDSEEELSCNSFDDEEGDKQTKGREESEGDKTDES
nr:hypothetical protein [Tanacetum cinerariifolium]